MYFTWREMIQNLMLNFFSSPKPLLLACTTVLCCGDSLEFITMVTPFTVSDRDSTRSKFAKASSSSGENGDACQEVKQSVQYFSNIGRHCGYVRNFWIENSRKASLDISIVGTKGGLWVRPDMIPAAGVDKVGDSGRMVPFPNTTREVRRWFKEFAEGCTTLSVSEEDISENMRPGSGVKGTTDGGRWKEILPWTWSQFVCR
ncbi:hypothetical protein DFS33DRAFT_1450988 [Desarmillaria ectypa]|nr:hypothetical protein DFS33DRAFT_1450988 [Desarmillaria ectypa]